MRQYAFKLPDGAMRVVFHESTRPLCYRHSLLEKKDPPDERDCPVAGYWEERIVRKIMES